MIGNSLAKLTDAPDVLCTLSGLLPWQDALSALDLTAAQGLLILWPIDYPMWACRTSQLLPCLCVHVPFGKKLRKSKVGEQGKEHVSPSSFVSSWSFKVES